MLEDHMEDKHMKKNLLWNKSQESDHFCEKCEKKFQIIFVKIYHLCIQEYKYAFPECSFLAITMSEHFTHIEKNHIKKILRCDNCAT